MKGISKGCDLAILRVPSTTAFTAWFDIKKTALPYATEVVFDCKDGYDSTENWVHKILFFIMHKMQQKICWQAIGVSCVTREYLQKHYYSRLDDSVTSHYSSIELPRSAFSHPRSYPHKKTLEVIHVANQVAYNSRKGHNQLIKAVEILREEGLDVKLTFVGENYNDGFDLLSRYAEKCHVKDLVNFTGYLSKPEMNKHLLEADIAVLPTKAEGLPRVVIEAMAMGLPCITTPVSGNPELIEEPFLIDYNDINGFAQCIKKLVQDAKLYEDTSLRNFECSQEYCNEVLNQRRDDFFKLLKTESELGG